jgi:hypothetical protein
MRPRGRIMRRPIPTLATAPTLEISKDIDKIASGFQTGDGLMSKTLIAIALSAFIAWALVTFVMMVAKGISDTRDAPGIHRPSH